VSGLRERLAEAWHDAYEWQYGECDHGTYSGGLSRGEPYRMCFIQAGRLLPFIAAERDEAAREALRDAAREIDRDHVVPPRSHGWDYRNGYWDGAMNAARVLRDESGSAS
jgi:hypothetical protein